MFVGHFTSRILQQQTYPFSMTLDNCINALVDIFHTEVFAKHEVQDVREDAEIHHFGSRGRTYDPKVPQFY